MSLGISPDLYLWNLAQHITCEQEFYELGLHVFKLPINKVATALHNKRDINLAAHHILQIWSKQYADGQEAFEVLVSSLKNCRMNQIAATLFQDKVWTLDKGKKSKDDVLSRQNLYPPSLYYCRFFPVLFCIVIFFGFWRLAGVTCVA